MNILINISYSCLSKREWYIEISKSRCFNKSIPQWSVLSLVLSAFIGIESSAFDIEWIFGFEKLKAQNVTQNVDIKLLDLIQIIIERVLWWFNVQLY